MAEFCTVVGTVSACMSIVSSIGNTVCMLRDLHTKFKEAQKSIDLMVQRLRTIKLALTRIHNWAEDEGSFDPSQATFIEGISVAIDGCQEAMDALVQDVRRLVNGSNSNALGLLGSTRYIWNNAMMKEHEDRLKLHVDYLFMLVNAVKCTSNSERNKLMKTKEYTAMRDEIVEDTCSLRSTKTPSRTNSMCTSTGQGSIPNPDMQTVDSVCKESKPYRRATAAQQRKRHDSERYSRELDRGATQVRNVRKDFTSLPKLDIAQAELQRKTTFGSRTPRLKCSPLSDEGYHSKSVTPASTGRFSGASTASPSGFWNNLTSEPSNVYRSRAVKTTPFVEKPTFTMTNVASSPNEQKGLRKMLSSLSFRRSSRGSQSPPTSLAAFNAPTRQSLAPPGIFDTFGKGERRPERNVYQSLNLNSPDSGFVPRIVKAAQEGSLIQVKQLLAKGENIEEVHLESGRNALAVAAHCGNVAVVQTLLEHQACLDELDNLQCTPLHLAASRGHYEVVMMLIRNGAKVDERDAEKRTALWLAASNGHIEVVEYLLTNHAKVGARAKDERSLLHHAASKGDRRITELLLQCNADVDAKDGISMAAIHYACREGHQEIVESLLASGASKESLGPSLQTPLISSAAAGQRHIVEHLLKRKANVKATDDSHMNALHWACQNGHADVADLLLSKKVSIECRTSQGKTPLHLAILHQHFDVVELLLRRQADCNSRCHRGYKPLHYACAADDLNIIRILIESGASIEAVTSLDAARPLHIAVSQGNLEVVELLLSYGVAVDCPDNNRDRPIILACYHGHLSIVERLVEAGSTLHANYRDQEWYCLDSPLCVATQHGHIDICAFLISNGASVDQADEHFWSPLRYAVHYGQPEILELLLLCDAEISPEIHKNSGLDDVGDEFGFHRDSEISQDCKGRILHILQQAAGLKFPQGDADGLTKDACLLSDPNAAEETRLSGIPDAVVSGGSISDHSERLDARPAFTFLPSVAEENAVHRTVEPSGDFQPENQDIAPSFQGITNLQSRSQTQTTGAFTPTPASSLENWTQPPVPSWASQSTDGVTSRTLSASSVQISNTKQYPMTIEALANLPSPFFELDAVSTAVERTSRSIELEAVPIYELHGKSSCHTKDENRVACSSESSVNADSLPGRLRDLLLSLPPGDLTSVVETVQKIKAQDASMSIRERLKSPEARLSCVDSSISVESNLLASTSPLDGHVRQNEQSGHGGQLSDYVLRRGRFSSESFSAGDESRFCATPLPPPIAACSMTDSRRIPFSQPDDGDDDEYGNDDLKEEEVFYPVHYGPKN